MQTGTAKAPDYTCFNLSGALEFLGDRQGVQDLLPVLCSTLSLAVPETADLIARGNMPEAAQRLHSLKGFVPVFCYAPLVEELTHVERLCRGGPSNKVAAAYAVLRPSLQRLGEEAAHYLAQSSAP
jgi:hypothetical protein